MRQQIAFLFSVTILIPTLFVPIAASAQQSQSQQGLPPGEVAATCPPGSHWVDAGYSGRGHKYREGHCQKEFAHMEK
jgi:hypothetical protein